MSKSSFYRKCRRFLDANETESRAESSDAREDLLLSRQEPEANQNEKMSNNLFPTGRL